MQISILGVLLIQNFIEGGVGCCYKKQSQNCESCCYRKLGAINFFFNGTLTFRVDRGGQLPIHIYCSWFLGSLPYIVGDDPNTNLHIR